MLLENVIKCNKIIIRRWTVHKSLFTYIHPCQTILSQSDQCYFWKNWQASIRGGDPRAGKKQMHTMFVVWTRMLYLAKMFFEIVRLCCRTIPNEII